MDLIEEEINYIPTQAFKYDRKVGTSKIKSELKQIRELILGGRLDLAKSRLGEKVFSLINSELKDEYIPSSELDVGKERLGQLTLQSILRLKSALPSDSVLPHPLFRMRTLNRPILGERSKLHLDIVRRPEQKDNILIYEIYSDGQKIYFSQGENAIEVESSALPVGSHTWHAIAYMVSKTEWNALNSSVDSFRNEKSKLEIELIDITNPAQRADIEKRILKLSSRILAMKTKLTSLKKQVGKIEQIVFQVE